MEDEKKMIGVSGKLVDLFDKELTQDEWNALCIIHRLRTRLDIGIRFDWSKSIDVKSSECSQIIDESVFINKELKYTINMKKTIYYLLMWFVSFIILIGFGMFVSGNTNVMDWEYKSRSIIIAVASMVVFISALLKYYK